MVSPTSSRVSLPAWRYEEEDAVEHTTPLWMRFKFKPQTVVQILSIQIVFCLVFQLGNTFRVSYCRFGPNLHGANLRQFTLTATEILQADLRVIRSRGALLSFLAKKCRLECHGRKYHEAGFVAVSWRRMSVLQISPGALGYNWLPSLWPTSKVVHLDLTVYVLLSWNQDKKPGWNPCILKGYEVMLNGKCRVFFEVPNPV